MDMQEKTKRIIREDIEAVRAYADCFGVEMPDLDENGEVVGLPAPIPERWRAWSAAATASMSWP